MTSNRPYRPGMDTKTAIAILEDGAGKQWDPKIVPLFIERIALGGDATDPASYSSRRWPDDAPAEVD
jgi:HD-GYP domain-containing protein (c-di-GMP phosphodiesterase class II)